MPDPITRTEILSALARGSAWASAREPLSGQGSPLDVLAVCIGLPRDWKSHPDGEAVMRGVVEAVRDTVTRITLLDPTGGQVPAEGYLVTKQILAFAYGVSLGRALNRPLEEDPDGPA